MTSRLDDVPDIVLVRELTAALAQERARTAELMADIGEIDARNLYWPAFPSIHGYVVGKLRYDEDEALTLVLAARTARRFPAVYDAVADGRLHLEAVVMLEPHLTAETVEHLITAATHKSETEIARLLAEHYLLVRQAYAGGATEPGDDAGGGATSVPGDA